MSTYGLPTEPGWLVKSRKVAYCARRLDLETTDLPTQDMGDPIQVATMVH